MAWDIHGHQLKPGYCEVHPDVPESWPCGYCRDEMDRADMDRAQEEQRPPEDEPIPEDVVSEVLTATLAFVSDDIEDIEPVRESIRAALRRTRHLLVNQISTDLGDEAAFIIANGDVAEVAAPSGVPETGRTESVAARDALLEDPVAWLREYRSPHAEPPTTDLPPF